MYVHCNLHPFAAMIGTQRRAFDPLSMASLTNGGSESAEEEDDGCDEETHVPE